MRNIIQENAINYLWLLSGLISHLDYTNYCTGLAASQLSPDPLSTPVTFLLLECPNGYLPALWGLGQYT